MKINYITQVSKQDTNALANLNYQHLVCDIDFKNLLVKKPWGSEYLLFENKACAIWILNINSMENTSMHCHPQKDTSLVCLDAEVSCNTLNDTHRLKALDAIFLSKKVFHQTQSISKEGSCILEIETPINKFDLIRINDTYGRQGKEYEDKKHYELHDNLTLNFETNHTKTINKTKIELLSINSLSALKDYNKESILAIVSPSKECGIIYKLHDINEEFISEKLDIILISQEGKKHAKSSN